MNIDAKSVEEFDARLRDLLGVAVPECSLDLNVESEEKLEGCSRLLVRYNVDTDERIGAYLLVPDGLSSRTPAILAIHQHAGEFHLGKSEPAGLTDDPMYHYGLDLCRRGYVVLCPDLLAFEERRPPEADRISGKAPDGMWYERFEGMRLILEGSSMQAKYLSDLVKGLDCLCSLDIVDPQRLGVIGHSLGGQETLWLTWFDKRVAAAVSSCGFAPLRAIIRDGINHNMACYVPGFLRIGDVDLIAAAIAPRAFCFTAGDEDGLFPIDSVRETADLLQTVYRYFGAPENTLYIEFHGGHGFPDNVKERAYAFLDCHLRQR